MSDVPVAPQGAPPAAPSPQGQGATEVPINPSPQSTPNPIGSQAPPAPTGDIKGSEHRPQSRREAIQAAFDRANKPPEPRGKTEPKPAAKAADARVGHNNPPEPTEQINLRKRPPAEPAEPQPRDRGRFVSRETVPPAQQPAGTQPAQQQAKPPVKQLPRDAPFRDPPMRSSESSKAEWANTPEPVRADIHRLQKEFVTAYNEYKGAHEAMQPIRRFHQMAIDHGTTLEAALTNYTGMEAKLRADPVAGLDLIVHNLNLKTADGQRLGLRDIAYHVLSQTPDQLRQIQQGNNLGAAAHQIGALHQEVQGLKTALQQMHNQQQFKSTRGAVDQFADSHPRFDELGDLIEGELKLGFDLETAYRRAELLRPSTQAAQTRTTPAQTRPADKSIAGAPGYSNGAAAARPRESSRTPRDAVANAIRRVNGL
jgi:hypothetical protein